MSKPSSVIGVQRRAIFVFGSSMNSAATQGSCPGAKLLSAAYLPENELCFPRWHKEQATFNVGYRAATGKRLWGVVWSIPENEMASLDYAKGCKPGQPGHHYDRVSVTVRFADGSSPIVETYRAVPGESGQPTRAHLDLIIAGAEEHELPSEYIAELKGTVTLEALPDFRSVA